MPRPNTVPARTAILWQFTPKAGGQALEGRGTGMPSKAVHNQTALWQPCISPGPLMRSLSVLSELCLEVCLLV